MRRPSLLLLVALVAQACATGLTDGDRFFLAGDLPQAELAYRSYLTAGRAEGNAKARARYRLGLIYALPESDLHDIEKAERALNTLIELEPDSAWAQQASLILELWAERARLDRELAAQRKRADFLVGEIARAHAVATRVGDEVEDRDASVDQLAQEIGLLRREIDDLKQQLDEREQELELIKKVDLQPPP